MALHELIKEDLKMLGLHASSGESIVSSADLTHHADNQLRSMWLSYGRSTTELKKFDDATMPADLMHVHIVLGQKGLGIYLVAGTPRKVKTDREYFKNKMNDVEYRKQMFKLLNGLGAGYWVDVACERKNTDAFQTEDAVWEFTKADQWMYYDFTIGRSYAPDAIEISNEHLAPTIVKELARLSLVFHHMRMTKQ